MLLVFIPRRRLSRFFHITQWARQPIYPKIQLCPIAHPADSSTTRHPTRPAAQQSMSPAAQQPSSPAVQQPSSPAVQPPNRPAVHGSPAVRGSPATSAAGGLYSEDPARGGRITSPRNTVAAGAGSAATSEAHPSRHRPTHLRIVLPAAGANSLGSSVPTAVSGAVSRSSPGRLPAAYGVSGQSPGSFWAASVRGKARDESAGSGR